MADSPLAFGFTTLRVNSLSAFGSSSCEPTCHRSSASHCWQLAVGVRFLQLRASSPPEFGLVLRAGSTAGFRLRTTGRPLCWVSVPYYGEPHPLPFSFPHGWATSLPAFRPLVGSNPPVVSGLPLGATHRRFSASYRRADPPAQATCAFTTKSVNAVYSSIRPKWGVGLLTKKELAENGGTHGKPTAARANRTGRFHVFLLILQAPSSIRQPFPPAPQSREPETADLQALTSKSRCHPGTEPDARSDARWPHRDLTPAYSVVSKSSRTISSSSDSNSSSPKKSSAASLARTAPVVTLAASSSAT